MSRTGRLPEVSVIEQHRQILVPAGTTGAEAVIRFLEHNDVEHVFGIPGVHTLALYDALRESTIRHVLARHEQGAGFMADGYARASGKPGVAFVITGPGVTNIATPLGQAYTDSSPVLVISSNLPRAYLDGMRGNLHDLKDQLAVTGAVTKWNGRAMDAASVSLTMEQAFDHLMNGRPLPVHVEFPLDVLDEPISTDRAFSKVVRRVPEPDRHLVEQAASVLREASYPVIYCGGGAVYSGATDAITQLAEHLNAPVLTSIMGKGAIAEDHPLAGGASWQPGNELDALLRRSDCVLVVGSKLGYQTTEGFRMELPSTSIRIDIDPQEMTLNMQPSISLVADARVAVEALLDDVRSQGPGHSKFGSAELREARQRSERHAYHAERRDHIDALRRAIPRDGILSTDMTMMAYVATYLYPVYEPRTFFFPNGFGTLGFALPAAIGAKIARPDATVVAVAGDGGFLYTMAELGVAVQERLGIPIVIFNDSTYSAVKSAQATRRGGRYFAVDLVNPDYVELARAYGIAGVRVESPEELEREVALAAERDLPTIIDVPIPAWN